MGSRVVQIQQGLVGLLTCSGRLRSRTLVIREAAWAVARTLQEMHGAFALGAGHVVVVDLPTLADCVKLVGDGGAPLIGNELLRSPIA